MRALETCADIFKPAECENYFNACGYDTGWSDSALTHGELFWKAELFRLKGELLLGQSDQLDSTAEQCFGEALEIARNQHAKMLELRAATSLAKLWQKRSQLDDAKRVLKSVYSGFTEGLETPDLIEAKTVLDQL
jgi:predicted ATPase